MEAQGSPAENGFYRISFLSKPGSMQKTERGEIVIDEETLNVYKSIFAIREV